MSGIVQGLIPFKVINQTILGEVMMLSSSAAPTGLRWFQGKNYMSYIRGGDYTHPGEEQAILETLSPFPKDKNRLILDVACGLGGTANFIQKNGWGKVVGFDIEPASIEYAKQNYPGVVFFFFFFFFFFINFFFFKYVDLMPVNKNSLIKTEPKNAAFLPLRLENINEMLKETGWQCSQLKRMDNEFKKWYADLLIRIKQIKDEFITMHGEPEYEKILGRYTSFYNAFVSASLGGCALYAQNLLALEHQHKPMPIRC